MAGCYSAVNEERRKVVIKMLYKILRQTNKQKHKSKIGLWLNKGNLGEMGEEETNK